jgi:hypothetical protein
MPPALRLFGLLVKAHFLDTEGKPRVSFRQIRGRQQQAKAGVQKTWMKRLTIEPPKCFRGVETADSLSIAPANDLNPAIAGPKVNMTIGMGLEKRLSRYLFLTPFPDDLPGLGIGATDLPSPLD